MFFQRIKTPGLAHSSYMLGDAGQVVVVDPRRDVDEYLRIAADNKLTITHVLETHRQEDFVLGSAELARIAGARVVNGRHELFGHGDVRLRDGEELTLGAMRFVALHTPGHTPESMSYAVFLSDAPQRAWAVFTGDALFIGESGRTDLPDPKRTGENAGILYDAIHAKLLPLGDQTILYPAHGAGSVCGGNIANRDESTIGLEREYNAVFTCSRSDFVRAKVAERIPHPPYFSVMEKVNLGGGLPISMTGRDVRVVQPKNFASESAKGIVIDTRAPEAFAAGHIPRSYSIWADGLPVFGGWIAGPDTPIFLVLASMEQRDQAVLSLARIGLDKVEGVLAGGFDGWRNAGLPIDRSGAVTPREVEAKLGEPNVLDVRDDTEFERGHIPHATHLYVGYLQEHLERIQPPLERNASLAVTCSVGHRASLAVSILRRAGYDNVSNMLGGMTAWTKLELPTEKGAERSVTTPEIEGRRE